MKTLFKGLIILAAFFGMWLLLSQIDFVTHFKIDPAKNGTEKSIGNIIWDEIKSTEEIILNDSVTKTIDKLLLPLCKENNIERDSLKVHIIQKDEVNAFALPDGHLVVYSGLIEASKNESALIGVLGHEIAHIKNNHVMRKLSKEIGLSVLLSLTTGNNNGQVVRDIFQTLSSSAYDRSLEKEADMASVEYMLNANVDPAPFADFLYEMSFKNPTPSALPGLALSEAEERSKYVLDHIKGKKLKNKAILSQKEWEKMKQNLKNNLYL